ncbi:hypothetical protein [Singulisphaera acidiphila]|nr:hypothetical protein [Singulisphaera acidiphila]
MALVALVGSLCSADIALKKRGYILVDFEHIIIIKNNTLNHPLKIIGIENDDITFEHDIKIKFFENNGKLSSCDRFLELQPESDAIVAVYKSEKGRSCGIRSRKRFPLVRIPIIPRAIDENYRILVGRAWLENEPLRPSQRQIATKSP